MLSGEIKDKHEPRRLEKSLKQQFFLTRANPQLYAQKCSGISDFRAAEGDRTHRVFGCVMREGQIADIREMDQALTLPSFL